MPEQIASWTTSRLVRFIQDYMASNPLGSSAVLTVDELTVSSKLTVVDQAEASQQAQAALREQVFSNKAATSNLTLTTALQDVPGLTFTVPYAGAYVVHGTFDFEHSVTGGGFAQGALVQNGTDQGGNPLLRDAATNIRVSTHQVWLVNAKIGDILKLQAKKTINAGTVTAYAPTSTLVVHKL